MRRRRPRHFKYRNLNKGLRVTIPLFYTAIRGDPSRKFINSAKRSAVKYTKAEALWKERKGENEKKFEREARKCGGPFESARNIIG